MIRMLVIVNGRVAITISGNAPMITPRIGEHYEVMGVTLVVKDVVHVAPIVRSNDQDIKIILGK